MIINKIFMSKLKDFGLNSYEIKIWTALLSRGVSSAGELSDISNVPRSRAYDVLESLEKKGFIIMKIGKPIKYIAVPPEEVIDRVKNDIHENAKSKINLIEEIKNDNVLEELNMLFNQGVEIVNPTDFSGALKSRDNIYQTINQMVKNAEKSIIIMTTTDGLNRKSRALKKSLEKAKKRGVSIQIAAPITKDSKEAISLLEKIAEIKHIEEISARFVIVDGKQVTFNLMNDSNITPAFDAGIWLNTEFFAGALQSMFNSVWEKQKEIVSVQ